ncbi:MAG TPA: hypothetical protein VFN26_17245 [Candidatus Acidoferrum sp.]|nr:hypothetical protein [Candidatus Acidoferrum sp.]
MQISPILVLHVSGGITGILSGAVAMIFRKGGRRHVVAGKVFVIAMLCMSGAGAYMAYFVKPNMGNVMGGVMTFYMVATAWMTARRRDGETSIFDWGALLVALAFAAYAAMLGFQAAYSPTGLKEGYPPVLYFIWGSVALLSVAGDVRMLLRGGVFFGSQRIVRHLWRMCFGLFIATGSFFLGQQKVFPASWRGLTVWFVPALLPLVLLIYWVLRVWFTKEYKKTGSPNRAQSSPMEFRKQGVSL